VGSISNGRHYVQLAAAAAAAMITLTVAGPALAAVAAGTEFQQMTPSDRNVLMDVELQVHFQPLGQSSLRVRLPQKRSFDVDIQNSTGHSVCHSYALPYQNSNTSCLGMAADEIYNVTVIDSGAGLSQNQQCVLLQPWPAGCLQASTSWTATYAQTADRCCWPHACGGGTGLC